MEVVPARLLHCLAALFPLCSVSVSQSGLSFLLRHLVPHCSYMNRSPLNHWVLSIWAHGYVESRFLSGREMIILPRHSIFYTHMNSHEDTILMSGSIFVELYQELLLLFQEPWLLLSWCMSSFYQQLCVTIPISVTIHSLCCPSSLFFRLGRTASSSHVGSECLHQVQVASAILPRNSFLKELTPKTNLKIFLIQQPLPMSNYKFKLLKW